MELLVQQSFAVFNKKIIVARRDRKFLFFGLVFPLLTTIAVILVNHLVAPSSSNTPVATPLILPVSTVIPYITSPGVDPSYLFPYFPKEFNFKQFSSIGELNSVLLKNQTIQNFTAINIIGGYNFVNITGNAYDISVWYNDSYGRVVPSLTRVLAQAIYAYQSNNASATLEETAIELSSYEKSTFNIGPIAAIIMQYGIMFILPYFAITLVSEKEKQLKEVLLLNSLSRPAYWIGTCIGDIVLFSIPNAISLILMWSFKISLYSGSNAGPSVLVILLTGWAGIPFIYILSFIFDKEESANRWVYSTISIFSAIPVVINLVFGSRHASVFDLMSIIPPYGYSRGLNALATFTSISIPCALLFADGFVFWAIVLLLDYKVITKLITKNTPPFTLRQEDGDVVRERESVLNPAQSHLDEAIVVKQVVKSYDNKFVAVKGVSFRVNSGECFGLLGPNGAGKTSILGVMYGSTNADSGKVDVPLGNKAKVQGVCPQFDVLWDLLTGREHLSLYARVKGLKGKEIDTAVQESLELFGLIQYADQQTQGYSGGTKRKLCSAIALLADPQVVYMDEPSTGMDPVTRRLLWNVIEQKKHGRAVILTTHSMEEAEALCTRVGIMVKGQLRCIGSPQHLRNTYGSGYRLTVNTPPENAETVRQFVNEKYTARSQMIVGGVLHFDLQQDSLELHKIFLEMEQSKAELGIEGYCISQTSLEQVFLRFALEQEDEETEGAL